MEPGVQFVLIQGQRKYACRRHFSEWYNASQKDKRIWDE
jgi:hypothetical protein